jgi:hypothetical protein
MVMVDGLGVDKTPDSRDPVTLRKRDGAFFLWIFNQKCISIFYGTYTPLLEDIRGYVY